MKKKKKNFFLCFYICDIEYWVGVGLGHGHGQGHGHEKKKKKIFIEFLLIKKIFLRNFFFEIFTKFLQMENIKKIYENFYKIFTE